MRVCPTCYSLHGPDQAECPKDTVPTVHWTEVLIGLRLGPYIVRTMVSEGGMGVVYAGEHPTLGRRVALKVLRPELSLRDDIVERFTQEARSVNTIEHRNIVNIYDFGKTPFGSFYIVMEFLDGSTLRQILDRSGAQPLKQVGKVVGEVGLALDAAHKKGFAHRDVKPENIMLYSRSGAQTYVKLLDFGIAKLLSSNATRETSGAMGTPQYMSPEQLDDGLVDHRADVFALGAVAYEMCTGQVPFPGGSPAAVRQAQLTRVVVPASSFRHDLTLSTTLNDALAKALALDPGERHQSAAQFVHELRTGIEHSTKGVRTAKGDRGANPLMRWIALGLLVAVMAISGVLFYRMGQSSRSNPSKNTNDTRSTDARTATERLTPAQQRTRAHEIVQRALTGADAASRLEVAKAIAHVHPTELQNAAIQVLSNPRGDPLARRAAAQALGRMPDVPKSRTALRAAATKEAGFLAIAASHALQQLGDRDGEKLLLTQVSRRGTRPSDRSRMRFALESIVANRPKLADKLARFARTARWTTARRTARIHAILAKAGHSKSLSTLREKARSGAWDQRVHAAAALGSLAPKLSKSTLAQALQSAPIDLHPIAASALLNQGDTTAEAVLLNLARSNNIGIRVQTALALGAAKSDGRIGADEEARQVLAQMLVSEERRERAAAAVAILAFLAS